MKRLLHYTVVVGVLATVLSSCTIRQKAVPMAPLNAQVNFTMDDLEYIGDVTGSATQSYVLGFIPYGGRKYHVGAMIPQGFPIIIPNNRGYNNAMYDALMQKPDADFVLPVSFEIERQQQFLGNRQMLTLRCKAFKIKGK
ncbi:MAG: hypothetical protein HKN32_03915 [Flavobacteriales bacterium]|nr:hypothetical protein [Flavobacteriales bacterium]